MCIRDRANGTAKPKRRAKVKDAEKSATGKVKGREKISSDKDNRIVKKVVLERTEKGLSLIHI